jgi:hypothetical protein
MGSGNIVVCPFCLSMYLRDYEAGDPCPDCEIGEFMDYDEYKERLTVSFMINIAENRGFDNES